MFVEKLINIERFAKAKLQEYGLEDWKFEFDNAKHRMGQCRYEEKEIGLSTAYVEKTPMEELEDTVLHEIAHALVGPRNGHNNVWKCKAMAVGARPTACGGEEAVSSAKPNYVIECSNCGKRWYRFRLRRKTYANAKSSCCKAEFKFYKIRK